MRSKGNHWAARLSSLTLLLGIFTVPYTPSSIANPSPTATRSQKPLTVIGEDRISSSSIRLILSSSGGSGTGAVTFKVEGRGCSIDPTTLVLSATLKTQCVVTAMKAASTGFNAETSPSKSFEFPRPFPKSILIFTNTVFTGTVGIPITLGTLGGDGQVRYSVSGKSCSIAKNAVVASAPTICRVTAESTLSGIVVSEGKRIYPYVSVYKDFTFAMASPSPTPTTSKSASPTPKPTSGVITQPSPMPSATPSGVITQPSLAPQPNSGVDCTSNPSPLCGGSVAQPSTSAIPAPTPIVSTSAIPAPTPIASPAPATTFVEVLCFETYPAGNNPKTPVTATIASRVVESMAESQSCPMGMTRKINVKPIFTEAGIFLSSDKTQINYSPAKDNSAGAGNRLERFFACNTQISISPKRSDIPKTTTTISRTFGDDEMSCPKGSTFVATVFYYGYKTIKGQAYGGIGGQWPDWTYRSQPTKQKTSVAGTCAFDGQVGFWESSAKHVLVCRPDAKSGRLTWTQ